MQYALMVTGIIFSVLSIFTFSMGWEMWRDSLKNGSLVGIVEIISKEVPLNVVPKIKLLELDGLLIDEKIPKEDGSFLFTALKPGQYLLNITGDYIYCPQKTINIFPSRDSDIGKIECSLTESKYLSHLFSHSQITSTVITKDNRIWTTGFRTDKHYKNSYVLFHSVIDSSKWTELVVPDISNAERGAVLYEFSSGELFLGTNGRGAISSKDNGLSWKKIELPIDISSINYVTELPNNKWLLIGQRLDVKYGTFSKEKPQSAIFTSDNLGKTWDLLSEHSFGIKSFINHSSGRLILGTDSLHGKPSFLYSEDGGRSWQNAKTNSNAVYRAINTIIELKDSSLIAGTADGKNWKNTYLNGSEFIKGGRFLKSENGGKDWIELAGNETWGGVSGILELEGSKLLASEGGNLLWSLDNGAEWFHFGKSNSYWVNNIFEHDSKIIISGNSSINEISKEKLIFNYLKQKQ